MSGLPEMPNIRGMEGPINVGIQDADLAAAAGHGEGQIHRGRRFSYAAFSRGHGDDRIDTRQFETALFLLRRLPGLRRRGGAFRGQNRGHRQDPRQGMNGFFGGGPHGLQCLAPRRIDLDPKGHMTVLDLDPGDHAERDDALAAIRIFNVFERRQDGLAGNFSHGTSGPPTNS